MSNRPTEDRGRFKNQLQELSKTRAVPSAVGSGDRRPKGRPVQPAKPEAALELPPSELPPPRLQLLDGPAPSVMKNLFFPPVTSSPSPVEPSPFACQSCQDKRYVITAEGEYARARLCTCSPVCTSCNGRGYELKTSARGYLYHERCRCQDFVQHLERFNQALVPNHYAQRDLSNYVTGRDPDLVVALQGVRNFTHEYPPRSDHKPGLLIVGRPGVGKTHLAVGIVKVLTLDKGVRCLFKDFFLLLAEVRSAFNTDVTEQDLLQPLVDVEVLVIDELGKGRTNSDWEQGLLDQIICKRYNMMKTTILTTNFPLDPPEPGAAVSGANTAATSTAGRSGKSLNAPPPVLEERIGDRIFSRLKQMCKILRINGRDYRE